jgi:hypothetical protein
VVTASTPQTGGQRLDPRFAPDHSLSPEILFLVEGDGGRID